MKIKDVQIDGFGVWTGLSVDSLPEGMTVFYGPNEAGKTTLMQFTRTMLYGFTDDRREKYLPPVYGGTPGGAIRVTGPGGGYQIRRHSQLTDTGPNGQLSVTGQDGLSQGQHRLGMLLGQIDEPIFTNVFAIGMRELQELGTLDDTSAADELYKLSSGLDRVSLVDVLKSLRGGRRALLGDNQKVDDAQVTKLASLIEKRERLRDEVQSLTRGGRRWAEMAALRRAQQQEIDDLTERMSVWDRESRCVETATGVLELWQKREGLREQISQVEQDSQLPDEAPGQLVQIDAMMEDRRQKLEEVKNKRRGIREKAEQLPVSRRMLDLQGRIEAASEQATWVEALEEQIQRLDVQIEKARGQLSADAERFGMDDDDREAILEGDTQSLPDLSRQTLATLSAPAKQVKEEIFHLKQARSAGQDHKSKADKLEERLKEVLDRAHASNLQQAIHQHNSQLSTMRHRLQLGEHLDKLKRHYRGLEKESVDLTTAEALPLDRLILLSVPFIVGGIALIYGFSHVFGVEWFLTSDPDPTWGMLYFIFGIMSMLVYYFGRQSGQRTTLLDLEDCDRQIDVLRRQIREVEAERDEVDSTLPTSSESLETRIRATEVLLADLEAALPTFHAHQAALQGYQDARSRASSAAERLKDARRSWSATLDRLGLSESMSPSSVRSLSDGYESLMASRRRLDELQSEREQRQRERQSLAKRIELLYVESLEVGEEIANEDDDDDREELPTNLRRTRSGPLEQLNHLHEELARQQHWIKRRRDLKEQDQNFKRQQSSLHRGLERCEQQRRALWAKCGVATPEQFYSMVDTKAKLAEMRDEFASLDQQIRSMIGAHAEYDDVAHEIEGAKASDLEKRWESLTTRMTETEERIASLRTQQGELSAEMKHLGDDNRLSTVQLELGCVERQIASQTRRWQTLAMASSLLEDVCATFERERQPETLREASSFLSQLTDGKYTRIWTPLGTNQLKIDGEEKSLPLEVLSRGTREAVFIALRLSLAAAYARRGVMLPLVLDDVLVNFDGDRAVHAAQTLKTFAELGHQVMMFTCHEHIVEIFHEIDVEVRMLPAQGEPGRATVLLPEETYEEEIYEEEEEEVYEPEAEVEEVEVEPEPEPEPEPVLIEPEPEPEPIPEPEPKIIYVERPAKKPKPKRRAKPKPTYVEPEPQYVAPEPEPEPEYVPAPTAIDWAWFEQAPTGQPLNTEARANQTLDAAQQALDISQMEVAQNDIAQLPPQEMLMEPADPDQIPDDVWNRNDSWWDGKHVATS